MLKLHPNAKGVIGIEMNKPEAIASMQKACEGIDNITVQPLVTKFPQGSKTPDLCYHKERSKIRRTARIRRLYRRQRRYCCCNRKSNLQGQTSDEKNRYRFR